MYVDIFLFAFIIHYFTVLHNGSVIKDNYPPLLDRLEVGSRVGIRRCHNGTMHVYVNGEDLGVAANNIPRVLIISCGLLVCFYPDIFGGNSVYTLYIHCIFALLAFFDRLLVLPLFLIFQVQKVFFESSIVCLTKVRNVLFA